METNKQACKEKKFITIEGNIGAGKSTFLKKLQEDLDAKILFEPCQEWQNIEGNNLLEEFYKNIPRWSFSFQLYAFLTRVESVEKTLEEKSEESIFFTERSIFADRYVFAQSCYESGQMSDLEWGMYKKWFDWTIKRQRKATLPGGIIYLETSAQKSMERIYERGRKEEAEIPFEYIVNLKKKHDNWLIKKENIYSIIKEIPVLCLNCDQEFEKDTKIWKKMIESIYNFLYRNFNYTFTKKELSYGNSRNDTSYHTKCS